MICYRRAVRATIKVYRLLDLLGRLVGDTFIDFCCFFQFKGCQSSRRLSKHPFVCELFFLEDEQVGRTTEEGGAAC